jgi:hypothetical protein
LYADYAAHTQDLISSVIPGNDDLSLVRVSVSDASAAASDSLQVREQTKNIIKGWLKASSGTSY